MNDYSVCGAFGKVRTFPTAVSSRQFCSLDHISRAGWHEVNTRYQISRPKGADRALLILTLRGQGRITAGGREYLAKPGTAAVLPKGISHGYGAMKGEPWEFYWLHYDGAHADACTEDIVREGGHLFYVGTEQIRLLFGAIERHTPYDAQQELSDSEALGRMLQVLLRKSAAAAYDTAEQDAVRGMIRLLEQNAQADFSLDMLCKHYHYSKEHIIRLFRNVTGVTPYRYWQILRFRQAQFSLENTDKSVSEIAAELGYRDLGSFGKQFKQLVGYSPTAYRKLYGNNQN